MKTFLLSLTVVCAALMPSCQQMCQMQHVPLKQVVANKSIAMPSTTSTVGVTAPNPLMFGLVGLLAANNNVDGAPFLNAFKDELRARGWRIVVSGITGRTGDTNSINAGADFTLLGAGSRDAINYSIVENKTGEEVLLLRGCAWAEADKKAKVAADELEKLVKKK